MQTKLREEIERRDAKLVNLLVPVPTQSEPLTPVSLVQVSANGDDPDDIFLNAVAAIDTQPLIKPKRKGTISIADALQTLVCVSLIGVGLFGIVWQTITFPHTLVLLFATEKPATISVSFNLPTRTLATMTIARSQTAPTTGTGHQEATHATGTVTFYNGSYASQTIAAGTVYTGRNGVQVALTQTVTISAAIPPQFGEATVPAQARNAGVPGNIQAYEITIALSNVLTVKNLSAFTGGSNARDFQAVAQRDLDSLTVTTTQRVNQAIPQAFPLRSGEALHTTNCTTKTTADHAPGAEAQAVTVKTVKTCAAVAYSQDDLTKQATVAFTTTRPGTGYRLVSTLHTSIISVSPLTAQIKGWWAYIFTKDEEQHLAEKIAGDTPAQAKAYLLSTGVITQASVPAPLSPAMYIDFLVLTEV